MTYIKYNIEDDVVAQIDLWIWASTTTINLKSWEGTQFPSTNWIIKFVQYNTPADVTSGVAKSENVLITWKSWDILTVTRWFSWDTPTTFLADDYVYLTNHTEVIKDIQDEVTRLETAKLNIGTLRTALSNAWKLFFSNWSNNETELSLWSNWTYLKSNWPSSTPSWWNPPLDVYWQTTITVVDRNADYITVSDWSDSNNTKKLLVNKIADSASETVEWLVERATDTEVIAKSDTTRYVSPAWLTAWLKDQVQARTSIADLTIYQASANGFINWYCLNNWTNQFSVVEIVSDSNATPTTLVSKSWWNGGSTTTFCVPIIKGHYYKITKTIVWTWAVYAYFTELN